AGAGASGSVSPSSLRRVSMVPAMGSSSAPSKARIRSGRQVSGLARAAEGRAASEREEKPRQGVVGDAVAGDLARGGRAHAAEEAGRRRVAVDDEGSGAGVARRPNGLGEERAADPRAKRLRLDEELAERRAVALHGQLQDAHRMAAAARNRDMGGGEILGAERQLRAAGREE